MRLKAALNESPRDLLRIPAILARLGRTDEAYQSLEEACRQGKYDLGDSLLDLCWDREDEGFKRIAKNFWGGDPPTVTRLNPVSRRNGGNSTQ